MNVVHNVVHTANNNLAVYVSKYPCSPHECTYFGIFCVQIGQSFDQQRVSEILELQDFPIFERGKYLRFEIFTELCKLTATLMFHRFGLKKCQKKRNDEG